MTFVLGITSEEKRGVCRLVMGSDALTV